MIPEFFVAHVLHRFLDRLSKHCLGHRLLSNWRVVACTFLRRGAFILRAIRIWGGGDVAQQSRTHEETRRGTLLHREVPLYVGRHGVVPRIFVPRILSPICRQSDDLVQGHAVMSVTVPARLALEAHTQGRFSALPEDQRTSTGRAHLPTPWILAPMDLLFANLRVESDK